METMKQPQRFQYVAIVADGARILTTLVIPGRELTSKLMDRCFEHAERCYGANRTYELCDLLNPRHQILFEEELEQYMKEGL